MNIVTQHVLRGPNLYSRHPRLLTVLDLQQLRGFSSAEPEFLAQLLRLLPSLYDHRCSVGKYGGFVQALNAGTNLAHVIEHVTIALQCMAGTTTYSGRTLPVAGMPGQYRVICSYELEQLAIEATQLAIELVTAMAAGEDVAQRLEQGVADLHETAQRQAIGPSTGAILKAARERGIPIHRLTAEANLFVLGWGARQKRLQATITADTGHIAVGIASDKQLTKTLLREAGVPVPKGVTVRMLEQAQQAAEKLGGIVTIKPLDGNHGRGVTTRCGTPEEVAVAFNHARAHGRSIIVERFIRGDDYRVLVAGKRVVAAALRRPASVTGDGVSSVRELVEMENRNPARGEGHSNILTRIPLDEHAETVLATQGLSRDSVPPAGQRVALRGNANLSSGGTAEDVTDRLPAATRELCVRAVRTIGLDVAGIDLVCEDIARPLDQRHGAIIEINAAPGIRMHQYPSAGTPRDAGSAIVDSIFGQHDGRIPVIAVTGTNGKTTTALMIEHTLRRAGIATGCATTGGVTINGALVRQGDCSGYWSARTVLSSPEVEFAVLETARGGILKRGLAFDRCDVAVVLNISEDHLGLDGIDSLVELAQCKAVVAQAASKAVVLNVEDDYCRAVGAGLNESIEIIYFSCNPRHATLLAHLDYGGRAVWLEGGRLMAADAHGRHCLLESAAMPSTLGGCARHNIANGLAAAAALMASGLPRDRIAAGLLGFVSDARHNPLRCNVYHVNGAQLIVDYDHNPAAISALAETARAMASGRTTAVVTAPGDRRDEHFRQIGEICSASFDTAVFYEWDGEHRGRPEGERAGMMLQAAVAARGHAGGLSIHHDGAQAVREALARAAPGDVLLYACGTLAPDLGDTLHAAGAANTVGSDAELAG